MTTVLLARDADHDGYLELILADRVGTNQAGADIVTTFPGKDDDGNDVEFTHTLTAHGQSVIHVPAAATQVKFPDGAVWKPSAK